LNLPEYLEKKLLMDEFDNGDLVLGLIGLGFILVMLVAYIFFLITQQNTLKSIKPHNQKMSPGNVWLRLIPVFNLIWQFIVVARIADSIRAEIDDRNNTSFLGSTEPVFSNNKILRPTYAIGLATCILVLCVFIPFIESLVFLGWLVCWIIYWTQLVQYKNNFLKYPW
jgi:hypothetical protein